MTSLDKFKLTAVTCDGDREPEKYPAWDYATGSMTRATEHGPALEDWFDREIGRAKVNSTMLSIFDNDPELTGAQPVRYDLEDDKQTHPEGLEAAASTVSTSTSQYSLGSAGLNYMDLSRASCVLDGIMYNVLLMNVKGTKSALLRCACKDSTT